MPGVQSVPDSCSGISHDLLWHRDSKQQRQQRQQRAHRPVRTRAPFAAIIPGTSVAETVLTTSTANFLNLYNAALVGRIILTWFPNPPAVIAGPLACALLFASCLVHCSPGYVAWQQVPAGTPCTGS